MTMTAAADSRRSASDDRSFSGDRYSSNFYLTMSRWRLSTSPLQFRGGIWAHSVSSLSWQRDRRQHSQLHASPALRTGG